MPIRRLPEDGAAAGIYTLLEAIDTMPPVLSRAESAFDRLAGSITGALDRVGAALDTLERLRPAVPSPGTQIPQFQDASFTSSEADLLALGEDRLHLEDLITESMVEQLTASENIATAQEDAARRSDAAWGTLSDDIAQDFDRAFAGISENGADTFASIWQNMASGLGQAISAIDWDNILGDGAGSLASAASSILGSLGGSGGGFSGLFEAGGSLLSSFLPSLGGAGAGAGGSFLTGIAGSLGSTGTIGAIAAVAALGLNELFKDKDYPFAKAVIGIQGGTPAAESSFELDGGPLDDLLQLQDRVLTALDAMTDRLGVAFSGNAGNFLQIGYSSGRKANLPTGYFVGGLETTGDFATGADLSGIEDEAELIARAIELSFAKAVRDGNLTGLSGDSGTNTNSQKTFEAGIEKLLAAPFESLETSLRRVDFLASFEETVSLFRDGTESVDAYNRALRSQRIAIEDVGWTAASDAFEPIRLFLEDAVLLFSGGGEAATKAGLRLAEAGDAVRGMARDLLDTLSLNATETPLEGVALLYEQQATQIASLVPALESLNRELEALGLETIDVAAEINAANDALSAEVRTLFLQEINPERAAAQQALDDRNSLLRQAEHLGYGQDRAILGRIEASFTAQLDRIGFTFSESSGLLQTFADSIEAATAGLDRQIMAQENSVGEFLRLADNLTAARQDFALDSSLSPHAPLDRLAQARTGFEELAAASADGDLEAREDLAASARTYLTLAREVHASSQAYTDIFYQVDAVLASALHETKAQITAAERQLDVLIEIRDRLEPQSATGGTPQYQSDGGGQYQSGGGGSPFAGYDLGYNPDTNLAILTALDAAGLPLPSGFGEGQLTRLRAENPAVNAVVTAMGFASGGIMTANGPAQTAPYDGGITSDVSVALFGEGSQPEAYVPLPDGRSIPVTLSLPANDDSGGNGETRDALRLQRADSRELVQEMKRLNREVAALRDDNERLNRVLGRAFSRQTA